MIFGHPYLTPWHLILLIVVVLNVVAGVFVFLRGRKRLSAVLFAGVLLCAAIWGGAIFAMYFVYPFSRDVAQFLSSLTFSSVTLMVYIGLLFTFNFPKKTHITRPLLFFMSVPTLFFITASHLSLIDRVELGKNLQLISARQDLYNHFLIYLVVYLFLILFRLFVSARKVKTNEQARVFSVATAFLFATIVGIVFNVAMPILDPGSVLVYIGPIGVASLVLALGWGVVRHGLFDLRVRLEKKSLTSLFVVMIFILGSAFFALAVARVYEDFWALLSVIAAFSLFFLNLHFLVSWFADRLFVNEIIDNTIASESGDAVPAQVQKLGLDMESYFGKFFRAVSVDVFFLDEQKGIYRSSRGTVDVFLSSNEPLCGIVRESRGVVFVDDFGELELGDKRRVSAASRKLRKINARAFVGMRHWTNELVMIAFVNFAAPTNEQLKHFRIQQQFSAPKWDEIASKIYTNMRAMEALTKRV